MTHCERLLAVLSDGREHDHHELYGLGMIVHSRVADLRKRGHVIEHRRDGDLSVYRLVGVLGEAEAQRLPRGADGSLRLAERATIDPSPHDGEGALDLQLAFDTGAAA